MSKMIKFPSIEQFRSVIRHVKIQSAFVGFDNDGEPIYDYNRPVPTIHFHGTVKLHGTNAAVCQKDGERWYQSRERILTPFNDNMGFAFWANNNSDKFDYIFDQFSVFDTVSVFGEWCGQGIQKGVGISQVPKMFVIFAIRINDSWVDSWTLNDIVFGSNIPNIELFQTFDIDIDFNHPELAQNELIAITEQVEAQCPVAHSFGVDGIGEGVVWICNDDGGWYQKDSGMWFKVKGEKHSVSNVKTLAAVDVEKVNSVQECVEKICTENRMRQGLDKIREGGLDTSIEKMGPFLKWLASDCIMEEMDTISESGLEPKDVGKAISNKGRLWFLNILKTEGV
jgi:hypothetical protein